MNNMKKLVEFELDGQPVYVETEISEQQGMERIARGREDEPEQAESRFVDAVARIKPAAEVVLRNENLITTELADRSLTIS
ncbi:MAG: hypothetical protein ACL93V_10550 [Candidatus Electrothrix sp. YB6]